MPRRSLVVLLLLAILVTDATVSLAQGSSYPRRSSRGGDDNPPVTHGFEMLMEAGFAVPTGNLGAEFLSEDAAMGAEPGFMLGLRARFYLSRSFSLAPVFSYTEFGDYDGRDADDEIFTIMGRILRFGLDAVFIKPGRHKQLRPFAGVGAAFVKNKYREDYVEQETFYSADLNNFQWSAQVGLRWRNWELALEYHHNRFSTARFLNTGTDVDYDWSHVVARLGVALPRI